LFLFRVELYGLCPPSGPLPSHRGSFLHPPPNWDFPLDGPALSAPYPYRIPPAFWFPPLLSSLLKYLLLFSIDRLQTLEIRRNGSARPSRKGSPLNAPQANSPLLPLELPSASFFLTTSLRVCQHFSFQTPLSFNCCSFPTAGWPSPPFINDRRILSVFPVDGILRSQLGEVPRVDFRNIPPGRFQSPPQLKDTIPSPVFRDNCRMPARRRRPFFPSE